MESDMAEAARWFEKAALAGRTDALEAAKSLK